MSRHTEVANLSGPRHRLVAALVVLLLAVLGALVPAASASAVGVVTGQLLDQHGQPVVGVAVRVRQLSGGSAEATPVTDASGVYQTSGLGDGLYEAYVVEGSPGSGNQRFSVFLEQFTISGNNAALGIDEVDRYMPVRGTITNWSAVMGDVSVRLHSDENGPWSQVNINPAASDISTDGTFEILAPIRAAQYTLFFVPTGYVPFVDAYLGGGYNEDPASATHLTGSPGVGFSGITMVMPAAAVISGHVSSGGTPITGIDIEADGDDGTYGYDVTDGSGEYTLFVRPGIEYEVYTWGSNYHAGMSYDGWQCGCDFDPVTATLVTPAEDIDFDLDPYDPEIIGNVLDGNGNAVGDLEVRLFRASGGVWVLEDDLESDTASPNFSFLVDPPGMHRVQFVDDDGDVLTVVDGGRSLVDGYGAQLTPVPACYAAVGDIQTIVIMAAVVDTATTTAACGSIEGTAVTPVPSAGTGTSGTQSTTKPRANRGGTAAPVLTPTPTPTPTPSATPTPTASPRPSASQTPAATAPSEPAPTSSPDLWWLLWVGLGILLIVVIGAVVLFVRRA